MATGGAALANLALTTYDRAGSTDTVSITSSDTILAAWHVSTAAAVATIADITSEVSVPATGYVECSTTDTTSDQLIVFWHDNTI
jgi:hypothetical protein